jgi:molybdopterin-guanine dinucleotide biosynthesis protein A
MTKEALGFAVAGGLSRRMRRDKALLPWGASTLLDHTLDRLRAACGRTAILCGPERRYADRGAPVLVDAVTGAGALGGVCSGLAELKDGPGLFLAVDLPLAPVALLRQLLVLAEGWDAVVPSSPDGPEPLCAVYTSSCLEPVRHALREGRYKMTAFWPEVRVREVAPAELRAFGDPARIFRNVNSPEDYDRARLREP